MRIAYEGDDFRIGVMPGNCRTAVVAFAGVGFALGGVPVEDFRRSLTESGPDGRIAWVFHVVEKRRLWYNNGGFERLLALLAPLIARFRGANLVTLGNSMGGFGAMAFCRRLGATRALAFGPQSTVDPRVSPYGTRWPKLLRAIETWDVPDALTELDPARQYYIVYGAKDPLDCAHAERFGQAGIDSLQTHGVPGCAHNAARVLRERGQLRPILQRVIWDPAPIPAETFRDLLALPEPVA